MCVAITAVLHYLFLATFLNMLGMGLYYFMSITVTYYAMYVANNFKSKSRIHWILVGTWGKYIYNQHSFFNVWWICFNIIIMKTTLTFRIIHHCRIQRAMYYYNGKLLNLWYCKENALLISIKNIAKLLKFGTDL